MKVGQLPGFSLLANPFMLLLLVVNLVGISWIARRVVIALRDRSRSYSGLLDIAKYMLLVILVDSMIFSADTIASGKGVGNALCGTALLLLLGVFSYLRLRGFYQRMAYMKEDHPTEQK